MNAGVGDERAVLGDLRLAALQGVFVELGRAEVPVQGGEIAKAETVRAEISIVFARLDHHTLPIVAVGFWNSDNPCGGPDSQHPRRAGKGSSRGRRCSCCVSPRIEPLLARPQFAR